MARLRLIPLVVGFTLASPSLWAWNPYDTDSSWASGEFRPDRASPGDYRAPQPPRWDRSPPDGRGSASPGAWDSDSQWYLSGDQQDATWSSDPRADFGPGGRDGSDATWQSGSSAPGWNDRNRWRDTTGDGSHARRQSNQGGYWNETVNSGAWSVQQDGWSRNAAPRLETGTRQRFTESSNYAPYDARRYEFRHDPELDSHFPGNHNGWEFRPRSERENARSLADSPYPRIDERDYLPRGPWRSYQDEGAAFGYHADEQWPSYSSQPPLR